MPKAKRRQVKRRKLAPKPRAAAPKPRAIEVALAGLAHDIRTPLTGIVALADLLSASDLPPREQSWAAAIRGAAGHLARLTTVVVDAARAGSAGLVLHAEPFSPGELAQSVAGSLAARAEAKGLAAEARIATNFPARVHGDAVRLRGALENLVDNAVKFTERGCISFSARASRAGRGRVRLTFVVADSGIGMTAADLKRLFRPFAQASADVARRYGGSGLGLVFVKRIAQAMGGGVRVTSRPGRGSTFRLDVVVENERDTGPRGAHASASGGQSSPALRVLCVEDNPYGRIVLIAVLSELGHRVSFVGSGEAAVETVARNEHDAVLMDIALAGIDGIAATRRIRALPPPAGRIPIIGVSARDGDGDEAAARAVGMDAYLRKPAAPAQLHEALRAAVVRRAGSLG